MFNRLLKKINKVKSLEFDKATEELENFVYNNSNFLDILEEIGAIPESIEHDSTEEKLFSKVSDIVLSRAFIEIGLDSEVLKQRSNSADVFAESKFYGYSLVADAKSFRMSRTAKNQKDFKINSLSKWKGKCEYSILCSPYFQYPKKASQIYSQSMNYNVCLFSWEHFIFLIKNKIKENNKINFECIWNFGQYNSNKVLVSNRKECFLNNFNKYLCININKNEDDFTYILYIKKSEKQNKK
ncbi:HindIII family type II restriction endonuclease [Brachyspira aalborgi]|uniref:HindIII family type II restriction endonuclease n=1 Tax=Brachyspira aalborgi TaxID=29522 RepID=A0A5C8GEW4_9SPIR|nr:HindIII family type II restriction endonuclease [Brachyspira aalborgi]TXJ60366.1 HindIII family type II restriction endonuclease [Brachyspira aalborgi]